MDKQGDKFDPALNAELARLVDELLDQSVSPDDAVNVLNQYEASTERDGAKSSYFGTRQALRDFEQPIKTPDFVHTVLDRVDRRVSFATHSERRWVNRLRKGVAMAAVVALAAGFFGQRYAANSQLAVVEPLGQHAGGITIPSIHTEPQRDLLPVQRSQDRLSNLTTQITVGALPPFPAPTFDFDHSHLLGVINNERRPSVVRVIRDISIQPGGLERAIIGIELDVDNESLSNQDLIALIHEIDGVVTDGADLSYADVTSDVDQVVLITRSQAFAERAQALRDKLPELAESLMPRSVRWIVLEQD